VDRWFVGAGVDYGWSARESLGISVGGGETDYDFNGLTGFSASQPWDTIEDSRVSVTGRFGFGEKGSVIISPTLRFNGEKDASSSDSRTFGLFGAVFWKLNENLTLGPGIAVFSELDDDTKIIPILAIEWSISDRWSLSTGRGLASSQGPGLTLAYKLNDDWSFGLSGRYENLEFRLDDKGVAAGGIGRDKSLPMVLSANLTPNRKISLSVFAGVEFAGKLKVKDALDVTVDEIKYDPAAIFGATFAIRF
jgi:hypothetical protein